MDEILANSGGSLFVYTRRSGLDTARQRSPVALRTDSGASEMKVMKTASVLVGIVGVAALALVYAPSVSGQRVERPDRTSRETYLFGGRAEIGAAVRDTDKGVVVDEVRSGTPAEKAGLKAGDVLVTFDGDRIRSARQFTRLVSEAAPNRAVTATVQRDGKRTDLQVTPIERSAEFAFDAERFRERLGDVQDMVGRMPFTFDWQMTPRGRLGVTVQELTPQLAVYFGAKDGLLVSSVEDDSAGAKAGLKAGDVITAVNGDAVHSRADLVRGLRNASDGDVSLSLVRDRKDLTVKAKIEARPRTTRR